MVAEQQSYGAAGLPWGSSPLPPIMRKLIPKRGYKYYFSIGKIEVDSDTGCWIWLGGQSADGYGRIRTDIRLRRRGVISTHKYFWELYHRLTNLDIGHKCHRRLCVNPRHLEEITHTENMQLIFRYPKFSKADEELAQQLFNEGYDTSYIAERLMAPRPAVMRLLRTIDRQQLEFGT